MRSYQSFTECYYDLIDELTNRYEYESAPRGMSIRESLAVQFEITNPRDRLLYVPERKFSLSYMIAELVWYFSGNNTTAWIANYSKFWANLSDDGETANSGYGARLFRPHPRLADGKLNQWDYVVEELRRDHDSRRAVMHIRTPWDSLPEYASKDVPCTLTLQFFIREEKLHMIASMRSSDIIRGIAYDVPFFTMLQEALALELGVGLGTYRHISGSLHVYERHYKMCEKILSGVQWGEDKIIEHFPFDAKQIRHDKIEVKVLPRSMPMPPLPDLPFGPVKMLDQIQAAARATTWERVTELEDQWVGLESTGLDDEYWIDWAKVLLAHRAGKLKEPEFKRNILNSVSFDGYKFFDK